MEKAQNHHTPSTHSAQTWPGAFGAYKPSSAAVSLNLSTFLLIWAITVVADLVLGAVFSKQQLLVNVVTTLLGVYLSAASVFTILAGIRDQRLEIAGALKAANPVFWKLLGLNILVGLTVTGGLILLIVPGIIFAIRLSLAQYFLLDQNMGIMEAYTASWDATRGNMGKVWGIIGVCVLMILPVFTLIGIVATIYLLFMYQAATGLLYVYLQKHKELVHKA